MLRSLLKLKPLRESIISLTARNETTKATNHDVSHRPYLSCAFYPSDVKECFDINAVSVELGSQCHAKMIRSFLYTHFWPREPAVVSLWMSLDSPYLDVLSEKYSYSGDRLIAFERRKRTNEKQMIGLCVANKVFPWMIDELEDWAHYTCSRPERYRMYFNAHCLKSPDLYRKYNVDYIYDIEVLGTAHEVASQGVGVLLLKTALAHAEELRHPLVQVISVSQYTSRICEKCGMKRAWSMDYSEFVDDAGQRVFFPRRPHRVASIYIKYFDPKKSMELPCLPPY